MFVGVTAISKSRFKLIIYKHYIAVSNYVLNKFSVTCKEINILFFISQFVWVNFHYFGSVGTQHFHESATRDNDELPHVFVPLNIRH